MNEPHPATRAFLEKLNGAIDWMGVTFTPDTPIGRALERDMCDPDTFIACIAHALDIDEHAVDQSLIDPETDSVDSMMNKMIARHLPA